MSYKEAWLITRRGYQIWWKKYPLALVSCAMLKVFEALSPYVGIYIMARLINEIAGERNQETLTTLVLAALIFAALLSLVTALLSRWKNVETANLWRKISRIMTEKLLSMDFADVDDSKTHHLLSEINQNMQWASWGLTKLLMCFENAVRSLLTIIGAIALTISLFTLPVPESAGYLTILNHPLFVAVLVLVMLFVSFISPALANRAQTYWVRYSDDAKMGNRYFSFFVGAAYDRFRALDMRIYRQDIICRNFMKKSVSFLPGSQLEKYMRGPMGLLYSAGTAVSHIFTAVIYIFVCLKAWAGAFGVGSVTQYIAAVTAMSGGVSDLLFCFGELRTNASFLKVTFEFLDTPNKMYQGSLTTEKRSDHQYEIEFRNVSFKYPHTEEYALRNVSLTFNIGQRLAVVGQNGSGKTTFIKLLCRLYDPTEGEIYLNGIDIRKYDYQQYIDIFSVVFQDFKLHSFALGQNVATASMYDEDKVIDCLNKAGFGERLHKMPKGLNTCLYKDYEDDGIEISGGEAQKIALARALYKDAPFVILDEPTAALDPIAEFEVYSKMNEIVGEKTAVFISHRLSSCRFCSDIAVFHEGRLIQRGGHDGLVADVSGKYYELWNAQAQYYVTA